MRGTGFGFYLFGILGTGAVRLQVFNIAILNVLAILHRIVVHLLAAMFQFAGIILLPPEPHKATTIEFALPTAATIGTASLV